MLPSKLQIQNTLFSMEFDLKHEVNASVEDSTFRPAGF